LNKVKPLAKLDDLKSRPEIIRAKRIYGAIYGAAAGLAFAVSSWGMDAYTLQNSHAYYPWIKFIVGMTICGLAGLIVGWITSLGDSSLFGAMIWVSSAFLFAWLTVALPLQITPKIIMRLDPQLGNLLNYSAGTDILYRYTISLLWIAPFLFIAGIVQLPIIEPGVFSTTIAGKIAPLLFCILVMGIGGLITDNLINVYFRDAIVSMDNTIEFVLENEGKDVDPAISRKMHAASLRTVGEYLDDERSLFVGKYDEFLGTIDVLVKFKDVWFDCTVVYNQPVICVNISNPQ
jgi:hypothetical protein